MLEALVDGGERLPVQGVPLVVLVAVEAPMTPTERKRRAGVLVAQGYSESEAAEAVGVRPTTLERYKKDPVYLAAYEAEREAFEQESRFDAAATLARLRQKAFKRLEELLDKVEVTDAALLGSIHATLDRTDPKRSAVKKEEVSASLTLSEEDSAKVMERLGVLQRRLSGD